MQCFSVLKRTPFNGYDKIILNHLYSFTELLVSTLFFEIAGYCKMYQICEQGIVAKQKGKQETPEM